MTCANFKASNTHEGSSAGSDTAFHFRNFCRGLCKLVCSPYNRNDLCACQHWHIYIYSVPSVHINLPLSNLLDRFSTILRCDKIQVLLWNFDTLGLGWCTAHCAKCLSFMDFWLLWNYNVFFFALFNHLTAYLPKGEFFMIFFCFVFDSPSIYCKSKRFEVNRKLFFSCFNCQNHSVFNIEDINTMYFVKKESLTHR